MAIWRILTFVTLLAVTACKKTDEVNPQLLILQIDDRQQDCVAGVMQTKCLWAKENDASAWQLFYYPIEGFTYESGYKYRLEVQRERLDIDGLMDALPYKYVLIRVIEKTKV